MASQTEDVTAGQSPISNQNSPIVNQQPIANQQSSIPNEQSPITNQKSPISKRSTGPRTPEGKRRSSRNAYKHGLYSKSSFFWDAAIALGEDPRDFQRLLKGLVEARRPADALERALVEDIALLIWKKARLDAAESAVQVCNLQKHDLERRKQFIQVGREITDTLDSVVRENGLRRALDAPGKFELVLSLLRGLVEMVENNEFSDSMRESLRALYGTDPTLRGIGIGAYYYKLSRMKPDDPDFETAKNLMTARLAEEIVDVGREYDVFLHEHVENTRAARIAATAPSHAQWAAIIRQQNALHRQLERKIRLLEELQEKRKQEEARFRDDGQASWQPNPSDGEGPQGGGQRRAQNASRAASKCVGASGAGPGPNAHRRQSGLGPSAKVRHCNWKRQAQPVGASGAGPGPNAHRRQSGLGASANVRPHDWKRPPQRVDASGSGPGPNAVRPYKMRKKILNRGNELEDLLQAKGLAATSRPKRTPFCAQKVVIRAQRCGISAPNKAALPPDLRKGEEVVRQSEEERTGFIRRLTDKVRKGLKAKNGLPLCVSSRLCAFARAVLIFSQLWSLFSRLTDRAALSYSPSAAQARV